MKSTPQALLAVLVAGLALPSTGAAQGLIWSLPEQDGAWVSFEGDYQQVLFDPTGAKVPTIEDASTSYQCEQDLGELGDVFCWRRNITVKSLGRETGTFRGAEVDCRWIEIKTVTGRQTAVGIDPGPLGTRIVKVLVPEVAIVADTADPEGIPVQYIPVVSGWQKIGNNEATPIEGGVLQPYPALTLVAQYRRVEDDPSAGDPGLPAAVDAGTTRPVKGELVIESTTDRSTNTATLWRSDAIPFGLAAWRVTLIREAKEETAVRDRFVPTTRIVVDMKATAVGTDATSELVTPGT